MEEGSLLQEALSQEGGGEGLLQNSLWLDIYHLDDGRGGTKGTPFEWLELAKLAVRVNSFFQSKQIKWHTGGDGPAFGIHTSSSGIPHLRALCVYGANVADEWTAIGILLEFSSQNHNIAVECWDLDDGQVLLIEASSVLPSWVDQIGPALCRHRCWIREGQVQLIQPKNVQAMLSQKPLQLSEALNCLEVMTTKNQNNMLTAPEDIQTVLKQSIQQRFTRQQKTHKAALALPRSIAILIQERPDLVNAAILAFASQSKSPPTTSSKANAIVFPDQLHPTLTPCEDWVWTSHDFSRTTYAMLITIVNPFWKSLDHIPSFVASAETRRFKRQCQNEATPHLKHALQVGVRLVAGFNILLHQDKNLQLLSTERRILEAWPRVVLACRPSEDNVENGSAGWLLNAWRSGPNHSKYNLEDVIKCPVFQEELSAGEENPHPHLTPLSYPETSVSTQLERQLKVTRSNDSSSDDFLIPLPSHVDKEDWLLMPSSLEDDDVGQSATNQSSKRTTKKATSITEIPTKEADGPEALDDILDSFKTFMKNKSDVEGISHQPVDGHSRQHEKVQIQPRVFLHLLHQVLDPNVSADQLTLVSKPEDDPYFSAEDYNLMEDDENDEDSGGEADPQILRLMEEMDSELQASAASRDGENGEGDFQSSGNERVDQDVQVLQSLLESLDAGIGTNGPVATIMKEMGQEVPVLHSGDGEDSGEGDTE